MGDVIRRSYKLSPDGLDWQTVVVEWRVSQTGLVNRVHLWISNSGYNINMLCIFVLIECRRSSIGAAASQAGKLSL